MFHLAGLLPFYPVILYYLAFIHLSPRLFGAEAIVKYNDYCGAWNPSGEEEVNSGRSV